MKVSWTAVEAILTESEDAHYNCGVANRIVSRSHPGEEASDQPCQTSGKGEQGVRR